MTALTDEELDVLIEDNRFKKHDAYMTADEARSLLTELRARRQRDLNAHALLDELASHGYRLCKEVDGGTWAPLRVPRANRVVQDAIDKVLGKETP
jgi:hypothetical protein